jgi:hypothetical protein
VLCLFPLGLASDILARAKECPLAALSATGLFRCTSINFS